MPTGCDLCASPGSRTNDVGDILRELSVSALDALYDTLNVSSSLANVRLACRGLRDAIDGSVRVLSLNVGTLGPESWLDSRRPPLFRWPRCTAIELQQYINDDEEDEDEDEDEDEEVDIDAAAEAALPLLPFAGLSLDQRKRITRLTCSGDGFQRTAGLAVSALVTRLPALRDVELHILDEESLGPLHAQQLQLMFEGLGSLPHLDRLTLSNAGVLQHAALLACSSSLRRLEVHRNPECSIEGLQLKILAVLPQLLTLRELTFTNLTLGKSTGAGAVDGHKASNELLRGLLCGGLPPSLQQLALHKCRHTGAFELHAVFSLRAGAVTALELGRPDLAGDELTPGMLAELAHHVLLPCLAPGQRLERLLLHHLYVCEPLTAAHQCALATFLGHCCDRVQIRRVCLYEGLDPGDAAQAVRALRAPPEELEFRLFLDSKRRYFASYSVAVPVLQAAAGAAATQPGDGLQSLVVGVDGSGSGGGGGSTLLQLTSAADLAGMVLRRLEAAAVRPPTTTCDAPFDLVLLRGPSIALLAQAPDLLTAWLRWLGRLEAEWGGLTGASGYLLQALSAAFGVNPAACRVLAYQTLPYVPALLLVVKAGGAAALVAAAAMVDEPANMVEAVHVTSPSPRQIPLPQIRGASSAGVYARMVFNFHAEQALKQVWAAAVSGCDGSDGAAAAELPCGWLEWLLAMWEAINNERPTVQLEEAVS